MKIPEEIRNLIEKMLLYNNNDRIKWEELFQH
jgi:hypothetical protein